MGNMLDPKIREKAITRTSIIGIVTNVFLAAFKAGAGLIAGSISVVLDAVNNLTDAFSSIITILGIKLAKKKPDEKHPYGYGRIEYFSTILIAVIVLSAGVASLVESVKKIFSPTLPEYSLVTVIIIVISVITKLVLGRFVKGQGEKYASDALVASGSDASFDAIISASTLIGAGMHGPRKDGYLKMIEGMPARRAGTPDEVGDLAEFLMSSRGRFISGADILIDGGCTASYWYGDLQYLKATH